MPSRSALTAAISATLRREVDEVAGEQLEIGVDRAELDLAAEQHARDARRLRAGIGIVEPLRDAALEQVEMLRQHDARLHHVQIVDLGEIDGEKRGGEQIRLLLVVALQADPIARPNDGFQQARRVARLDDLALRQPGAGLERASRASRRRCQVVVLSLACVDINMWDIPISPIWLFWRTGLAADPPEFARHPMAQRAANFSALRAALVITAATSLGCDS